MHRAAFIVSLVLVAAVVVAWVSGISVAGAQMTTQRTPSGYLAFIQTWASSSGPLVQPAVKAKLWRVPTEPTAAQVAPPRQAATGIELPRA